VPEDAAGLPLRLLISFIWVEFRAIIGQTRERNRQAWPNTDGGRVRVTEQGWLAMAWFTAPACRDVPVGGWA